MAMFVTTRFDDGGFTAFLENVKGSKLKTALKSGLRKSLNIVKKKAVDNLKQVTFKNGKHLDVNGKVVFQNSYGSIYVVAPFKNAVMTKVRKDGQGGRVEIIQKQNDKNWNPILKMIEASKGNRSTKGRNHKSNTPRKAHSTGSIAHTFFTNAVQSTKGSVQDSLQKNLDDAINRLREKTQK